MKMIVEEINLMQYDNQNDQLIIKFLDILKNKLNQMIKEYNNINNQPLMIHHVFMCNLIKDMMQSIKNGEDYIEKFFTTNKNIYMTEKLQ